MNEILQLVQVDPLTMIKAAIFFVCGFVGMVIAYTMRWSRSNAGLSWLEYMTGDGKAVAAALTKLVAACWITGGFDYLSALSIQAIANGGVLLGLSIPDKVDEEKAQEKVINKQALKEQTHSEAI